MESVEDGEIRDNPTVYQGNIDIATPDIVLRFLLFGNNSLWRRTTSKDRTFTNSMPICSLAALLPLTSPRIV